MQQLSNYTPKCGLRSSCFLLCFSISLWSCNRHGACWFTGALESFALPIHMLPLLGFGGTTLLARASSGRSSGLGLVVDKVWWPAWAGDVVHIGPDLGFGCCEMDIRGDLDTKGAWVSPTACWERIETECGEMVGAVAWSLCFCLGLNERFVTFFAKLGPSFFTLSTLKNAKESTGSRRVSEEGEDGSKWSKSLEAFKDSEGTVMLKARDSRVSCFFFLSFFGKTPITCRWLLQNLIKTKCKYA